MEPDIAIILQHRNESIGLKDSSTKAVSVAEQTAFETADTGSPSDAPPPDGGLRAWSQVLVGHLINALTWGTTASFGVYQLYYTEYLFLPPSQVSWIGSVQVFLTFFISTFSGRSVDAGYGRHVVLIGSLLLLIGTFTTSLAVTYLQIFLAQGLCAGIGMGLMFMPAVTVVSTYFQKRKTMALAISASGSGVGSVAFPATVQYLIPKIGFPWAVRCSGFIALFFAILVNLLIRPRLTPRKSGPIVEWSALREPAYVLFAIGMFLIFWSLYFTFFYIDTYARNVIGFTDLESVNLLLVLNAVGVLIRAPLGYVADRWIGPINTLIPSAAILGLMVYVWIGIRTRAAMYVFAVVYGLATGATQGIFVGSLVSLTKDLSKTGTRFGMVCTFLAFATLAGPPIGGAFIQRDGGSFVSAQVWAASAILVGSLTLIAARVHETGWKWRVKI